ncbi:MAG: PorP/SprF family type IX secretion system membrane protein [Bacteroidales bacterium]|nr:PorP/SprF family type IX secretion system membrane protein [Bacteroidales bacterium]
MPLVPYKGIKYLLIIIGFLLSSVVIAQQAPQFTQYNGSFMFINAGFAGIDQKINVGGIARQQWVGFTDANGNKIAPQDFLIHISAPVQLLKGGLGASIIQDKLGFESNIGLQLAYSYHHEMNSGTLGIGAGLNLTNRSIDFTKFDPVDPNDPALLSSKQGDMLIDANFGLFYQSKKNFYAGLSVTNLFQSNGKNLSTSSGVIRFKNDRTFYLTAGIEKKLPNHPNFTVSPSFLIQSDIASTQYNLSTIVTYKSKFWGGLNYRFQESVGMIVGFKIDAIHIGYSYDLPLLPVGLSGSHEISVSYSFKIKTEKINTRYKNTRYL